MLIELLEKTRFSESTEAITSQFLSQWIKDADLFMGCVVSSFQLFIDPKGESNLHFLEKTIGFMSFVKNWLGVQAKDYLNTMQIILQHASLKIHATPPSICANSAFIANSLPLHQM